MRARLSTGAAAEDIEKFANWLKDIGDGKNIINDTNDVLLPNEIYSKAKTIESFIDEFYGDVVDYHSYSKMSILASKNNLVDQINEIAVNKFPGIHMNYE
jgi:hypothetical protein